MDVNSKQTDRMNPHASHPGSVQVVLAQHLEEVVHLRNVRASLGLGSQVELDRLGRMDERISAHLDGLRVAGDFARVLCRENLLTPGRGNVFASTVLALEVQGLQQLVTLLTLAESIPEARAGFYSGLGWASATTIRVLVRAWLTQSSITRQTAALAACEFHGVQPDNGLQAFVLDDEPKLASRALRLAATLGRTELAAQAMARLDITANENAGPGAWAGVCAVILGNRSKALTAIQSVARASGPFSDRCFNLAILAMPIDPTYAWLREWASLAQTDPIARRRLIRGCGLSGDVRYVPWLIEQMNDIKVTRIAGEAFTFITGANLALLDLERKPPENIQGGPNDDPEDDNVALDEDENLPWPDVARVHSWWTSHAASFPAGHRYLLGAPASEAQCLKVLNIGGQRQRAVAAVTRCLLKPGTPLFQVAAPAWRQKRWLAELGASSH